MRRTSTPDAAFGPGYKWVQWFGTKYTFNFQQAACIKVLWLNWLGGTPIVREEDVLQTAGVQARSLRDVFRMPPGRDAWGSLICNGDKRGTVRLAEPVESAGPSESLAAPSDSIQSPPICAEGPSPD